MPDSPMIDTAIGLMLFFTSISLLVTAIQEVISSWLKLRGENLKKGIEQLVGNKISEGIYKHPLMETMKAKKSSGEALPSYLKGLFPNGLMRGWSELLAGIKEKYSGFYL